MANRIAELSRVRPLRNLGLTLVFAIGLSGCQFQPLYSTDSGTLASTNNTLWQLSVAEVDTRAGQQVRNHLIFLLSGGSTPLNATHEVRLRIASNASVLAGAISGSEEGIQRGNTAGRVSVSASYDIFEFATKQIIHRGSRTAYAAYDRNNQSFAAQRALRDAENRAAREVAEQLRLAISSDFSGL